MIPELGNFSLSISLAFAFCLSVFPLLGVWQRNEKLVAYAWPLSYGMFAFLALSITLLGYSFVHDDFSVAYVANHSNSQLPYYFKISAIWGGHEGSLLLWVFILASWSALVALLSKRIERTFVATVLSVMGMISTGFCAFTLLTSNPFTRFLPNFPLEGRDLNPLLQDVGLIIHPPMLYMGYVGFSVAFAFAVAALISGKIDTAWARWSRPWTVAAWGFLTIGIVLGSWWAYYELGWGGWWFWDPVENASFMPWLVGTALMHSLAVTEKRGAFKSWTIFLAIIAFSLSLLGTFLVRSGVLTSVHAFASDPARGQFILGLLAVTIVCSLVLYAWRAPGLVGKSEHKLLSRESFLLGNNVILVVAWITVMLGTLYPLVLDFIGAGKLSIGPPYFNAVFSPLMAILAMLLGLGLLSYWKKTPVKQFKQSVYKLAIVTVLGSLAITAMSGFVWDWFTWLAVLLGLWILFVSVADIYTRASAKTGSLFHRLSLGRSYYAMTLGHLGFAMMIVGATVVSMHAVERDARMVAGQAVSIGDYDLRFHEQKEVRGPNYVAKRVVVHVYKGNELETILNPEKRIYFSQRSNPMTEAGIDAGFWRDIYVALGEELDDGAWAIRLQYKPLVRWIWLGSILMFIGGGFAVFDKRYRARERKSSLTINLNSAEVS